MNLILFQSSQRLHGSSRVRLSLAQSRHVRSVIKAEPGQILKVGELDGMKGQGVITDMTSEFVEMEVSLSNVAPAALPLAVAIALPRPKAFRRLLQSVVALGVKDISFFNAARVEKSYWQSEFLSPEKVHEQLILGLEQCGDTILPRVQLEPRFRPFFEDRGPGLLKGRQGWMAHPGAENECPRRVQGPGVLVVGPEGGFVPFEVDLMSELGFRPIRLGERILKTETAVTALVSQLYL